MSTNKLKTMAVGLTLAGLMINPGTAFAKKCYLAVWQPGTGTQWWHTGMSINQFKANDRKYFKQGLRLSSVDIYRYSDIPKRYSYTAVWRPGGGAQWWRSGMSIGQFKSQDRKYFKQGLRISSIDIQDGKVLAVWRPGVGSQWWRSGMSSGQFKSQDRSYFKRGFRLQHLVRHGRNDFLAVWRPGSGAQWWGTGMSSSSFKAKDRTYFKQNLRIRSYNQHSRKHYAVWRPGGGTQWIHSGLSLAKINELDKKYFRQGLRLTTVRAKSCQDATTTMSPPPSNRCTVFATAEINKCYNLNGTQSSVLKPGQVSASGCGPNKSEARKAAKLNLSGFSCLSSSKTPGCCTYRFR